MKPFKAFILKATGEKVSVTPKNGKDFTLEELKEAIGGGHVEVVRLEDGEIMVIDEEGKLKDLPFNFKASLLHGHSHPKDIIVGDALVCHTDQVK